MEATSLIRKKFWRFCRSYCKLLGIDPYLEEVYFQIKTRVVTVFAGRAQNSSHRRGKHVQLGAVRAALEGVNSKIYLDTGRQPLHQPESNNKYILPLQHMLKRFENKEPPQVKKPVVHPNIPDWL